MTKLLSSISVIIISAFYAFSQPSIQIINPQDGSPVQGGVLLPFWVTAQAPVQGVMLVEQYINGNLVNDHFFQTQAGFFDVFVTHYWRAKGRGPFLLEARVIDWFGIEAWADPVIVFKQ